MIVLMYCQSQAYLPTRIWAETPPSAQIYRYDAYVVQPMVRLSHPWEQKRNT